MSGAKPGQLLHMHEAVLEDRLAHLRGAVRHAHQRDELRLQIGGEAREGLGLDETGFEAAAVPRNANAGRLLLDLDAGRAQSLKASCRSRRGRRREDIAGGHRGRHGIGPGLDAVGKDSMLGAVERSRPWTLKVAAADALDPGAHLDQAVGDINDLRLARGVLDQGLAAGKRRGHQGIVGRANRDLGKPNAVAGRAPGGFGDHIAAFEFDFGAERLERGEMQIDGARADGAAAGKRDLRPAAARDERRRAPRSPPACAPPSHRAPWCRRCLVR